MPLKTFADQEAEHIAFLRSNGLNVESLVIGAGFVRCHAFDADDQGRGDYAYKTQKNSMNKPGMVGLVTWCRGPGGVELSHKSYGLDGLSGIHTFEQPSIKKEGSSKAAPSLMAGNTARFIWEQAKDVGRSDYLERKGVGAYGIRFLENAYGRVVAVPARDSTNTLRSVQFLNPDGSKRFLKGSMGEGLFHKLREPINGQDIGLAESYVTAATCLELSGIPTVCAFFCSNLKSVAQSLKKLYPASRLIIFADNDRHLTQNQGLLKAQEAQKIDPAIISLSVPDFGNLGPSKEASDWNDLVRLIGKDVAKAQIILSGYKAQG